MPQSSLDAGLRYSPFDVGGFRLFDDPAMV